MNSRPDTVPAGYGTVTPWIVTADTVALLEFLTAAFDAEELGRVENPPGKIGHAEVRIGDSVVMMFDTPFKVATPALLRFYVEDAAAAIRRAVDAGGTVATPLTDVQAWGDRVARVLDPLGNLYWLQERVEEVDPEDVPGRMQEDRYLKAMEQTQVLDAPGLT